MEILIRQKVNTLLSVTQWVSDASRMQVCVNDVNTLSNIMCILWRSFCRLQGNQSCQTAVLSDEQNY